MLTNLRGFVLRYDARMVQWAARLLLVVAVVAAAPARAQDSGMDDGLYGRLDGDLTLSAGVVAGPVLGADDDGRVAIGAELRARFLQMAGLVVAPEVRPGGAARVFAGVDLRPLFLARFLRNLFFADRFWDLLVDSIGLDLGVAITPLARGIGAALAIGGGLDVPIVGGLSIRLGIRYVRASPDDNGAPDGGVSDVVLLAGLSLQTLIDSGLADWEPRRYALP